jgi:Tol biopolymer transport system component
MAMVPPVPPARYILLILCVMLGPSRVGWSSESPCAGTSTQAKDLRVVNEKKQMALEVFDRASQAWRVVFRTMRQVAVPRRSPDGRLLAYVSDERGVPQLFLQRLSSGQREPISDLTAIPSELCFDTTDPVIHVLDSSGATTDRNFAVQEKRLP